MIVDGTCLPAWFIATHGPGVAQGVHRMETGCVVVLFQHRASAPTIACVSDPGGWTAADTTLPRVATAAGIPVA